MVIVNTKLKKPNTSRLSIPYKYLGKLLIASSLFSSIWLDLAKAESPMLRTLTVEGNGIEKIATTLAEVQLGVEIQGKTASEVQQEIAERTTAVVDLLRSKDVKQLQTTGVRLNPNYQQSNEGKQDRILIGYVGTNTVSFQIPIEQIGALLDEAVRVGASRIDGISFTATPEAISMAKKEALRKATIDAKAKGEVVLDTLDFTSQEIISIEVDNAQIRQPMPTANRQFAIAQEDLSTPIIGGEQTVGASVTLQIGY
jgi:uncharacterized protein YggE